MSKANQATAASRLLSDQLIIALAEEREAAMYRFDLVDVDEAGDVPPSAELERARHEINALTTALAVAAGGTLAGVKIKIRALVGSAPMTARHIESLENEEAELLTSIFRDLAALA